MKDLPTTHAIFYLSSRFAVASWFRNGLTGDEIDLHLCLVTREIHYNICMRLDLILTGEYLCCMVEGMTDGTGHQNKTHTDTDLTWIDIWHVHFLDNIHAGIMGQQSGLQLWRSFALIVLLFLTLPLAHKSWEQQSVQEMLKIFTEKHYLCHELLFGFF